MKHKKTLALALALVAVLSLMVGSLAFFTDHVTAKAVATAGKLDLVVGSISVSKTTNLKPGNGVKINFTLSNKGNKSADVKETLVLTSTVPLTDKNGAAQFDLYASGNVTVDSKGMATVTSGKMPITTRTTGSYVKDGKTYYTITYTIPEFILNGTGTNAEIESGITSASKASSYVLVFRQDSGNEFQNVSLSLDYEAHAKQHRNTNSSAWTATGVKEIISFAGNNAFESVPQYN